MRVVISKNTARGRITAPPSKSMAHRLLICAALANGESTVRGISDCEDVAATLDCVRALGVIAERDGDDVTVKGRTPDRFFSGATLPCRESGSTLRFLIPLALCSGKTTMLTGMPSLMSRPMDVYEKMCLDGGIT